MQQPPSLEAQKQWWHASANEALSLALLSYVAPNCKGQASPGRIHCSIKRFGPVWAAFGGGEPSISSRFGLVLALTLPDTSVNQYISPSGVGLVATDALLPVWLGLPRQLRDIPCLKKHRAAAPWQQRGSHGVGKWRAVLGDPDTVNPAGFPSLTAEQRNAACDVSWITRHQSRTNMSDACQKKKSEPPHAVKTQCNFVLGLKPTANKSSLGSPLFFVE